MVEKTIINASDGKDQLDRPIGNPIKGDWVKLTLKGYYIDPSSKRRKNYEDTLHRGGLNGGFIKWQVGTPITHDDRIVPGLVTGIEAMMLGEEAILHVPSAEAYGGKSFVGYCNTIPPDSDLELKVTLNRIARNDTWHFAKQHTSSNVADHVAYNCCRAF